jgi:flagellar hook protein FlgE
MAGLNAFSQAIKVIGNNTANMNTPGFKGSTLQFGDLVTAGSQPGSTGFASTGAGVDTFNTIVNFKAGDLRQTGNDLDLAVNGQGFFMLKNDAGDTAYTRDGQFQFDDKGVLINSSDKSVVQGLDASGHVGNIDLTGLRINPPKASVNVSFTGNLSSAATDQTVSGINVLDASGTTHELSIKLTSDAPTTPGSWQVSVLDGTTEIGTGTLLFTNGTPDPANSKISVNYTPPGQPLMALTLDLGTNVTSYATGNLSTLAFASQDGYQAGSISKLSFDATGFLNIEYSNGQSAKGKQIALARFDSDDSLVASGDNQFRASGAESPQVGAAQAGGFGALQSGYIEYSNVDLTSEFGDLVIMQRGYQASSQIVSTANEMIEQLFSMKGK